MADIHHSHLFITRIFIGLATVQGDCSEVLSPQHGQI